MAYRPGLHQNDSASDYPASRACRVDPAPTGTAFDLADLALGDALLGGGVEGGHSSNDHAVAS